jgi:regulator of replication initiation timing
MNQEQAQNDTIMQQVGMLNLRINDMMTQLNAVMKAMMEENAALKKENAELKAKLKENPKTK